MHPEGKSRKRGEKPAPLLPIEFWSWLTTPLTLPLHRLATTENSPSEMWGALSHHTSSRNALSSTVPLNCPSCAKISSLLLLQLCFCPCRLLPTEILAKWSFHSGLGDLILYCSRNRQCRCHLAIVSNAIRISSRVAYCLYYDGSPLTLI